MSYFDLSTRVFANSTRFEINVHKLTGFSPVQELVREANGCLADLKDTDDDGSVRLKWLIWDMRQSILLSIIPFDDDALGVRERISELVKRAEYFPGLKQKILKIEMITEYLLASPDNPKGEKVLELMTDFVKASKEYGLVTMLARGRVAGWSDDIYRNIKVDYPDCHLIASRKVLHTVALDKLILPSDGKYSPIMYDIVYGGRTESLEIVSYDCEYVRIPQRKTLPDSSYKRASSWARKKLPLPEQPIEESSIAELDISKYWEIMRGSNVVPEDHENYNQYRVKARLVMLPNHQRIFIKEDRKVVELSDIVENRIGIGEIGQKFPRIYAKELDAGDLILLRTSGSGEYLIDMADSLMSADGKSELRRQALEWKPILHKALSEKGTKQVLSLLEKKGHKLSSHNYLWAWTTEDVISPESISAFYELVAILDDLDYLPEGDDPVKLAEEKWNMMKEIKKYHLKAGAHIRRLLLDELKNIIRARRDNW